EGPAGGRCVWLFEVVDKPVVGVFVADAEFDLDRPRFANNLRSFVAILQLEFRLMFGEIFVGLRAAGFEQRDLQASLGEALAGPSSGSAGTDDNHVIRMGFALRHGYENPERMLATARWPVNRGKGFVQFL